MLVHRLAEAVKDLALVASAQIHARIGLRRHAHVILEVEVVEVLALRLQVDAAADPLALLVEPELVGENAVLELPAELAALLHRLPAVESVLQEVNRLAELRERRVRRLDRRIAPARENLLRLRLVRRAVLRQIGDRARQLVAADLAVENHAPRMDDAELVAADLAARHRNRRRPAPEDQRIALAAFAARDDHVSGGHPVIGQLQPPVADDRVLARTARRLAAAPREHKARPDHHEFLQVHCSIFPFLFFVM